MNMAIGVSDSSVDLVRIKYRAKDLGSDVCSEFRLDCKKGAFPYSILALGGFRLLQIPSSFRNPVFLEGR